MVVLGVLNVIEGLFSVVLGVIPSFTPPDLGAYATSFVSSNVFAYVGWLNDYLPLAEIAFAVSGVASVFLGIWVVKLVIWLLRSFHVLGAD